MNICTSRGGSGSTVYKSVFGYPASTPTVYLQEIYKTTVVGKQVGATNELSEVLSNGNRKRRIGRNPQTGGVRGAYGDNATILDPPPLLFLAMVLAVRLIIIYWSLKLIDIRQSASL